jgi:hypothetical protein
LKIINKVTTDHQMVPFVIEVLRVFKDEPVIHLNIYYLPESRNNGSYHQYSATPAREKALLVASRRKIISIPLQRCHLQTTCRLLRCPIIVGFFLNILLSSRSICVAIVVTPKVSVTLVVLTQNAKSSVIIVICNLYAR